MSASENTLTQTQARRRTTYGINVTIAIVAAVAITILINWLVSRSAWKLDLSANRRYTLAPQTLKILADVDAGKEDYEIITVFADPTQAENELREAIISARDLVAEYDRYAARISTQNLDIASDPQRYEQLLARLRDRYATSNASIIEALETGIEAVKRVRQDMTDSLGPLQQIIDDKAYTDAQAKSDVRAVLQTFLGFRSDIEKMQEQVEEQLDQTLPHYDGARANLQANLAGLGQNLYSVAIQRFERAARRPDIPGSAKEPLLASIATFKQTLEQLHKTVAKLQAAQIEPSYSRLTRDLRQDNAIVLIGPREVRVVGLNEMFRLPPPQQQQNEDTKPELSFQGEERLTGELVAMTLTTPPLVVFVTDGSMMPLAASTDPSLAYRDVARRLQTMNFELQQWSPAGTRNAMGQMQPTPPPQPKPGQKAVWVILPESPVDRRNPLSVSYRKNVADLLSERLAAGDSAMLVFGLGEQAQFGQIDPVVTVAQEYGVTVQNDRLVLEEVVYPDRTVPSPVMVMNSWPQDLPIGAAIDGMPGIFYQACPLIIGEAKTQGVSTYPLARITGSRLWVEQDLQSARDMKYDAATAGDAFTLAAAVNAPNNRLVIVGNPIWATDLVTTNANANLSSQTVGLAPYFGAAYPANAELFVNSVFWLSDMDVLIAASARTQDIRRIQIEPDSVPALRATLLAGMPVGTLVLALTVWWKRRRE